MLLSKRSQMENQVRNLEEKYGIQATEGIHEEVSSMCNYSSYIFTEGRDEGIILGAIDIMRDYGVSEENILQRITKKYRISKDDAKRLMDEEKELV